MMVISMVARTATPVSQRNVDGRMTLTHNLGEVKPPTALQAQIMVEVNLRSGPKWGPPVQRHKSYLPPPPRQWMSSSHPKSRHRLLHNRNNHRPNNRMPHRPTPLSIKIWIPPLQIINARVRIGSPSSTNTSPANSTSPSSIPSNTTASSAASASPPMASTLPQAVIEPPKSST